MERHETPMDLVGKLTSAGHARSSYGENSCDYVYCQLQSSPTPEDDDP